MFKTMTAALTAIALTVGTAAPVQARGLSEDDIGKLLFGLVAAATLNAAINNRSDRNRQSQAPQETHRPTPGRELFEAPQARRHQGHRADRILPRSCLRQIETRYGNQRMFTRRCLTRNNIFASQLPQSCGVRVFSVNGPRRGYDPQCLRDHGFRARRQR
jgi:hypothetical protein